LEGAGRIEAGLFYEVIGYLASILVAVSLTMRSILRLRVINLTITYLESVPQTEAQRDYVERMGFTPATPSEGGRVYRRSVP